MPTQIRKCTCQHAAQDALYGKNMRACNDMAKAPGSSRCTVCKAVISGSGSAKTVTATKGKTKK